MAVNTRDFEAELVRRGVRKWQFADAHGIRPDRLSVELRKPELDDSYMATLNRIAPVEDAGEDAGGPSADTAGEAGEAGEASLAPTSSSDSGAPVGAGELVA